MKYTDFIKGNEGFQYSINIQYDLNSPEKVKGYIPTRKSVEILKEYLLNIVVDKRDKATVLIGPYGKGKSHLLLVLLSIMAGNGESEALSNLIEKIRRIDSTCAQLAEDVLLNRKYMPIVINFNSGDLNQAFLVALNQALRQKEIEDILPNTYFDSAVKIIEGWREYEDTMKIVKTEIKNQLNVELDVFERKLKAYDNESYEVFKKIFKIITSGIEFNPLINTDVVKLYEETNYILKEQYGYNGMIIVFDEFSKFIEASVDNNSSMNLKILQDLAELSTRAINPQIHLVCITHKTINEYISRIPQEKIDAWRAIEGRFREILFNSSAQQNYELISNAIVKDSKKVEKIIKEKNIEDTRRVRKAAELFNYEEEFTSEILEGCFPLDPYTTYALPIISEKVAQNERTLFTYLSKDEPNSLMALVAGDTDFDLVTIDKLYDYFEPLFRKETFNEAIYDVWIKTDTALKIVLTELHQKIVKALGILYIINDFNGLAPTVDLVVSLLNEDDETVRSEIKSLVDTNILVLRRSNDTLDFIPVSSVDVNGKIKGLVETKFKSVDMSEAFNEIVHLKYMLPKRYNDEFKITRFFKRCFMTLNQVTAYSKAEKLLREFNSDGLIIDLIRLKKSDSADALKWLEEINDNRIIMVVPNEIAKITEDISEYRAIKLLQSDEGFLKEDAAIASQLQILHEDVVDTINDYILRSYDISGKLNKIYIRMKKYTAVKSFKLSEELSNICEDNFVNTPIINNELINKQELTVPLKKARSIILEMLLNGEYKTFKYDNTAVESSVFRATILNKGLLEEAHTEDIERVIVTIEEFLTRANTKELNFSELYKSLMSNERKLGLRKGIIPIYLLYVLKDYKEQSVIYIINGRQKKEVVLKASLFEHINNNPELYCIKIEEGTAEKEEYIRFLTEMFKPFIIKKTESKFVDIVNGMQKWIHSLTLYTQNHIKYFNKDKEISDEIIKLRKELMKYDINYRSFVFKDLLKYLKVDTYEECKDKIIEIKSYLDRFDEVVHLELIALTQDIFDKHYSGRLTGNLKMWYCSLSDDQKDHLYDTETNKLMKLIESGEHSEIEAIDRLAQIYTGLSIEDWNDDSISEYVNRITNSKNTIDEYEIATDKDDNNGLIKIVFEDNDLPVEKTFNKTEITPIGSTLFNAIEDVMDEYGYSVDDNEKRNILMEILSRYI